MNPSENKQPVEQQAIQPSQESLRPSAAGVNNVVSSPSYDANYNIQPQLKKYWRKNLILFSVGVLYIATMILIDEPAMLGPALYFMFVLAPTLVMLFVIFNVDTYLHNRHIKRGAHVPSAEQRTDLLAKILITSTVLLILFAVTLPLLAQLPPLPVAAQVLIIYSIQPIGILLSILAIVLLIRCIQQKHFTRLTIVALVLYGLFTVGGPIISSVFY